MRLLRSRFWVKLASKNKLPTAKNLPYSSHGWSIASLLIGLLALEEDPFMPLTLSWTSDDHWSVPSNLSVLACCFVCSILALFLCLNWFRKLSWLWFWAELHVSDLRCSYQVVTEFLGLFRIWVPLLPVPDNSITWILVNKGLLVIWGPVPESPGALSNIESCFS